MSDQTPRQLGAILDILGIDESALYDKASSSSPSENPVFGQNRDKVISWLYRILDTLDHKTGHLLQFTALLLAAQTLLARWVLDKWGGYMAVATLVLLIVPLLPASTGFQRFGVDWKFFGKVRENDESKFNQKNVKTEICELAKVCDERAIAYLRTRKLCFFSILSFVITLMLVLTKIWPAS